MKYVRFFLFCSLGLFFSENLLANKKKDLVKAVENGDHDKLVKVMEKFYEHDDIANYQGSKLENKDTILILAARKGHTDIFETLHRSGGNLFTKNFFGRTPLMVAAFYGYKDIVKYILSESRKVLEHVSTYDSMNALHYALMPIPKIGVTTGKKTSARALIKEGISVTRIDKKGRFPLFRAIEIGDVQLVKSIIETKDYNINLKTPGSFTVAKLFSTSRRGVFEKKEVAESTNEMTALMKASSMNASKEIMQLILDAEACDCNLQDKHGDTALMYAVRESTLENVELIIQSGADVALKNRAGQTAKDFAILKGKDDILHYLEKQEVPIEE